jgi:hypothetical protein
MKGTQSESDNWAVQKYKPPVVGNALQTVHIYILVKHVELKYKFTFTFC